MKRIFNDNESEKDYIGYEPYINVFKYIIEDNNNLLTPPIVFGLHGEWGMGKSTFMNILK
ncbi:P-loop NTPase fold protein, partial [Clostridium baratii]|uniref:P-loop NTPase fold protein n=1 Tax=Clostridium baratii TaxID=1561 RepID=UPI00374D655E